MILVLGDQYVGNWNNNSTHISSVVIHIGIVGRHTLFPCTCQIVFNCFDDHAASTSFYKSQIYDYPFHQTFCFVNFVFGILVSLNNNPVIQINRNAYFCQKINTHNHT